MSHHAHPQGEQYEDERVARPSRYRSLRKPSASAPAPSTTKRTPSGNRVPDHQPEHVVASSISRSMSRYRRRATSNAGAVDSDAAQTLNPAVTPPVPAIPSRLQTANLSDIMGGPAPEPVVDSSPRRQLRHTTQRRTTGQTVDDRDNHSNAIYDNSRDPVSGPSPGILLKSPEQRDGSWEAERDRLLEEQKMKDLQRLEEELEKSQKAKAQPQKFKSPVVDRFMLLAKGNKLTKDDTPPASPTVMSVKPSARRPDHEPARSQPAHIEPGGKGIVPQKDAPTSAINAGDRSVAVRFRHHTYTMPVTPETTAVDIISQTATQAGYDPETSSEKCIVIEHYGVLGLERRLRRYERIRDVMNSWDSDEQNRLVITLADPNGGHADLDVSAVTDREEGSSGFQLHMYHSNRPRKWNKKWITLLESGQIICAKKPNAKLTDKDTASLCHLSDYDIYMPTESQLRRHIKSPKRFCYAVKSQHKTTIFLNTDNYVQYFSTDDPQVAREFRERAHRCRSCYLVDRNPEALKNHNNSVAKPREESPVHSSPTNAVPKKLVNMTSPRVSPEEPPHAVERYEPLVDMSRLDKGFVLPQLDDPKPKNEQSISRRLSKRNPDHYPPPSRKRESRDGFTGGLLGDEYDNRKQALTGLEQKKFPQESAFTDGPSLLNNQQDPDLSVKQPDSSWFPSALEHTAKQRSPPQAISTRPTTSSNKNRHFSLTAATHRPSEFVSSTQHRSQHAYPQQHQNSLASPTATLTYSDRRMPAQPLVDLTPAIQVPPQWSMEKKGHGVKPPNDIEHLVDFIAPGNGMGDSYPQAPPRTMPRRPTTSGTQGRTRSMSSASPGRPLLYDAPPVPLLPSRHVSDTDSSGSRLANVSVARDAKIDRRETLRHKEREQDRAKLREQREREYREREAAYNAVPGRTGTLKVV